MALSLCRVSPSLFTSGPSVCKLVTASKTSTVHKLSLAWKILYQLPVACYLWLPATKKEHSADWMISTPSQSAQQPTEYLCISTCTALRQPVHVPTNPLHRSIETIKSVTRSMVYPLQQARPQPRAHPSLAPFGHGRSRARPGLTEGERGHHGHGGGHGDTHSVVLIATSLLGHLHTVLSDARNLPRIRWLCTGTRR